MYILAQLPILGLKGGLENLIVYRLYQKSSLAFQKFLWNSLQLVRMLYRDLKSRNVQIITRSSNLRCDMCSTLLGYSNLSMKRHFRILFKGSNLLKRFTNVLPDSLFTVYVVLKRFISFSRFMGRLMIFQLNIAVRFIWNKILTPFTCI